MFEWLLLIFAGILSLFFKLIGALVSIVETIADTILQIFS